MIHIFVLVLTKKIKIILIDKKQAGLSLHLKACRGKSGQHRASYFLTGSQVILKDSLRDSATENNRSDTHVSG